MHIKTVRYAVIYDRMDAGIEQKDLKPRTRGRIAALIFIQ
jgi:hypothetical protein